MKINYRTGKASDVDSVKKFLLDSWLMHSNQEPEFVNPQTFVNTDLKNYLKHCFDKSYKSYLIIAEHNGIICGLIKLNIEKIEKFFYESKVLYIDDIYVSKNYRVLKIATNLIEKAEKIAKKRKIKWLKARIYQFNEPAQKTFQSFGFEPLYSEYFKILK